VPSASENARGTRRPGPDPDPDPDPGAQILPVSRPVNSRTSPEPDLDAGGQIVARARRTEPPYTRQ
jgi:hypothetical protein